MKRYPIILIDRSVNAGIVGFRGSTQPTVLTFTHYLYSLPSTSDLLADY